jgi:hypothetical protein
LNNPPWVAYCTCTGAWLPNAQPPQRDTPDQPPHHRLTPAPAAAGAYARELAALLDERGFTRGIHISCPAPTGEAVLIVQLSDLHFNERVELASNRYDFSVAAARLAKLASRVKQLGRSYGASKVVVACLGDFLNSDRRLDELLSNATNRSKPTLLAVDILRAFLLDLRSEFTLEVYGITGNESRVKQELGWSDSLATDSYDLMIYAILRRGFEGVDGIDFCGFQANELLFTVMGRTCHDQAATHALHKHHPRRNYPQRRQAAREATQLDQQVVAARAARHPVVHQQIDASDGRVGGEH